MAYFEPRTLEFTIPYVRGPITREVGMHVALQIRDAMSEAVSKNYNAKPARFKGDTDRAFDPSLLRVINAANYYPSTEYGKELPGFLKIQYGNHGNICHIQLQPDGESITAKVELFGGSLSADAMEIAAEAAKEKKATLNDLLEVA